MHKQLLEHPVSTINVLCAPLGCLARQSCSKHRQKDLHARNCQQRFQTRLLCSCQLAFLPTANSSTAGHVPQYSCGAKLHKTSGSNLSTYRKLELILCYFGIRKVATHWVSMCFFCGIVPLSTFTPEVGMLCLLCQRSCRDTTCNAAHQQCIWFC